jgi:hypothetical protein
MLFFRVWAPRIRAGAISLRDGFLHSCKRSMFACQGSCLPFTNHDVLLCSCSSSTYQLRIYLFVMFCSTALLLLQDFWVVILLSIMNLGLKDSMGKRLGYILFCSKQKLPVSPLRPQISLHTASDHLPHNHWPSRRFAYTTLYCLHREFLQHFSQPYGFVKYSAYHFQGKHFGKCCGHHSKSKQFVWHSIYTSELRFP